MTSTDIIPAGLERDPKPHGAARGVFPLDRLGTMGSIDALGECLPVLDIETPPDGQNFQLENSGSMLEDLLLVFE